MPTGLVTNLPARYYLIAELTHEDEEYWHCSNLLLNGPNDANSECLRYCITSFGNWSERQLLEHFERGRPPLNYATITGDGSMLAYPTNPVALSGGAPIYFYQIARPQ